MISKDQIPKEVSQVTKELEKQGFSAYLVGGCVRDLLMDKRPKDWDITTNAKPEEIVDLFDKTFYENDFGTVTVVFEDISDETVREIEVTPFRTDGQYSDFRHPDKVSFGKSLDEDLARRDFTINALAFNVSKGQLVDLYKGQKDLKDKILRTVGNPDERFNEDPLRIMRGIRLAVELSFMINNETGESMAKNAHLLSKISNERIRDEIIKIIMSSQPAVGLEFLVKLGIAKVVIPEIEAGIGVEQNGDHIYDVWEHTLRSVQHSADRNWPLNIRLGALFHDVGKPKTRRWSQEKDDWTFYGHEVVGAKMAQKIMHRLKFPVKTIENVFDLIRCHMFFTDIDKITLSAVRRIIAKVGQDNVWDLMKLRACDRIGMGRPKENPYRLRKYESMIEEALRSPTSVGMLKIDGDQLMKTADLKPGPKIGFILHALLEEVLDKPELNNKKYLLNRAQELALLPDQELEKLGQSGKNKKEIVEEEKLAEIRKKHGVK